MLIISGDWHCAYVLLYGPRILEIPEGTALGPSEVEAGVEKMESENSNNAWRQWCIYLQM